jgi:hypothetical protein
VNRDDCPECATAALLNALFSEGIAVRVDDGEETAQRLTVVNRWRCHKHQPTTGELVEP